MVIEQTDVIDLIGFNREKKLVNLVLIDERPWEDQDGNWDEEHLELLERKVGAYMAYAKSRALTDRFPEFKGLPIVITVESKYPMSPDADKYMELAQTAAASMHVDVVVEEPGRETWNDNAS